MYEQKTNQSNLLTVCLILWCPLWSVKYGTPGKPLAAGNTSSEPFRCTNPSTLSTGLLRPQVPFFQWRPNAPSKPMCFDGVCSTNCTT